MSGSAKGKGIFKQLTSQWKILTPAQILAWNKLALWNRSRGPFVWTSGEICLSSLCNTIGCVIFIHWIGLSSI